MKKNKINKNKKLVTLLKETNNNHYIPNTYLSNVVENVGRRLPKYTKVV